MIPMGNKKDFMTGQPLVHPMKMRIIWGNLLTLAPINEALLTALESDAVKQESGDYKQAQIGEIFIKFSSYLKLYSAYCENQPYACDVLAELRSDSQFEAFLAERADSCVVEEIRNLDINAYLIKPVQRICKYPLFLRVRQFQFKLEYFLFLYMCNQIISPLGTTTKYPYGTSELCCCRNCC